jgi:hypothetical protein
MFRVPAKLAPTEFRISLSLASVCLACVYFTAAPGFSLGMPVSIGLTALCAVLSYCLDEILLILFIIALPAALLGAAAIGLIWR